jgi:serine/threonine protein kinase
MKEIKEQIKKSSPTPSPTPSPNVYILPKPSKSQTKSHKYILDCTSRLHNSNYTTKDWFEIKSIIEPSNNDENNKVVIGILDKYKHCVAKIGTSDTLEKEYKISKSLFSSNTMHPYCFFRCDDDYKSITEKTITENNKYLCKKKGNTMSVLLMPYYKLGNMRDFDFYIHQQAFYSCMKQTILSMIELCHNQGFYHNDLHAGNVLLKKTSQKTLEYIVNDKIYTIKTNGYKVILMDFEASVLVDKPKTRYYNKDFLEKDILRFITDMMTNSKKITFGKSILHILQERKSQDTDVEINIDILLDAIDNIKIEKYKSLEELLQERMIEYNQY